MSFKNIIDSFKNKLTNLNLCSIHDVTTSCSGSVAPSAPTEVRKKLSYYHQGHTITREVPITTPKTPTYRSPGGFQNLNFYKSLQYKREVRPKWRHSRSITLPVRNITDDTLFDSSVYYTQEFRDSVKKILPATPEIFAAMTLAEQQVIQERLSDVFLLERSWKTLVKSTPHSFGLLRKLIRVPIQTLNTILLQEANLPADAGSVYEFFLTLVNSLIAHINNYHQCGLRPLSMAELREKVDLESIYLNYIVIVSGKMYDSAFKAGDQTNTSLVRQIDYQYISLQWLYNHLVGLVFSWSGLNPDDNLISLFLRNGRYSLFATLEYPLICVNQRVIDWLLQTGFITDNTVVREGARTYTTHAVNSEYAELQHITQHMPQVTPPAPYNNSGVDTLGNLAVKQIAQGTSSQQLAQYTINFLNTVGQKKMRLNPTAISVIETEIKNGNGPIVNAAEVQKMLRAIKVSESPSFKERKKALRVRINSDAEAVLQQRKALVQSYIIDRIVPLPNPETRLVLTRALSKALTVKGGLYEFLIEHNVFNEGQTAELRVFKDGYWLAHNLIRSNSVTAAKVSLNWSDADQSLSEKNSALKIEIQIHLDKLKNFESMLCLTKLFEGYPLYYQSDCDYRLRIYPVSFLWSRTSGFFKYFICDFESQKLDFKSLAAFIFCYLQFEDDRLKFLSYLGVSSIFELPASLETKDSKMQDLVDWFAVHCSKPKKEDDIYLKILYSEIQLCIEKDFTTRFQIEIDQSSSVAMFFAIIFENEAMAKLCNMTKAPSDGIYTHLMGVIEELVPKDFLLYECFKCDRDFVKYLFMCWGYSQKDKGRVKKMEEMLKEKKGRVYLAQNRMKLKAETEQIAKDFEGFIDLQIPGICTQVKAFLNVMVEVTKNTNVITIVTPDKSVLNWAGYLDGPVVVTSTFNPITGKRKTVTYHTDTIEIDPSRFRRTFLPGYVHLLDASFVRLITMGMFTNHGYILQSIHDAFLMNPKYFFAFYKQLQSIYSADDGKMIFNFIDSCYIKPNLQAVECPVQRAKLLKKIATFYGTKGDFKANDIDYTKLTRMYSPECWKHNKAG
jgi:hypothetical protein